ncbi:hypothetical protein KQ217_24040 (plasmid) [Escherichia coli O170:H18]|uniref:hypothetical protein n=1 Tax=Escherichia coli TaxID=562 RepID=UPI001C1F2901|nr:hypothetical protein [Escherichia coli]QWV76888.1 hypothetical protein KQ217_24040 [Escherichia coli O170:H18]
MVLKNENGIDNMKNIKLAVIAAFVATSTGAMAASDVATSSATIHVGAQKNLEINVTALGAQAGAPIGTPLFKIKASGENLSGKLGLTDETRKSYSKTGFFAYNTSTGKAQLQLNFPDGCSTGENGTETFNRYSVKTCGADKNGKAMYEGNATLAKIGGGSTLPAGSYTLTVGAYDFQS